MRYWHIRVSRVSAAGRTGKTQRQRRSKAKLPQVFEKLDGDIRSEILKRLRSREPFHLCFEDRLRLAIYAGYDVNNEAELIKKGDALCQAIRETSDYVIYGFLDPC